VNGAAIQGAFQTILSASDLGGGGGLQVTNLAPVGAMPASTGIYDSVITAEQFSGAGLQIVNNGADAVPASILVTGDGLLPEPSSENGFKIERRTYAPDGREIRFDKVKQNDRVVVVLKATEIEALQGHLVVEDRLPAGFEIENPALLKATDLKAFSWLPATNPPVFSSFRDDRFIAAYSLLGSEQRKTPAQFTMAYVMRAVTPGIYLHSGAKIEDMYRPNRFARISGSKVEIVASR
jgi:hypothetical protein